MEWHSIRIPELKRILEAYDSEFSDTPAPDVLASPSSCFLLLDANGITIGSIALKDSVPIRGM